MAEIFLVDLFKLTLENIPKEEVGNILNNGDSTHVVRH